MAISKGGGGKLSFRTESEEVMAISYFPGLVQCRGISSMCLVSGACMHLFWVKIMVCGFCLVFFCEVSLLQPNLQNLLFVQLIEFLLLSEILPITSILPDSPGY